MRRWRTGFRVDVAGDSAVVPGGKLSGAVITEEKRSCRVDPARR